MHLRHDDLEQTKLTRLPTPSGTMWQVTEPASAAAKRLKLLGIESPLPDLAQL